MCQKGLDSVLLWQVGLYWKIVPPSQLEKADFRLALMEMRIALAKLIWQYDIVPKDMNQGEPKYDHKAVAAGQLEVQLIKIRRN